MTDSILPSDFRSLQREVFRRLQLIYRGDNLLSEIGVLLNLQRAAVYKRFSGDTMLRFDELVMIARHFDFSLESVFNGSKQHVSFQYDLLDRQIETYLDVFTYIKDVFDSFRNYPDNTLIYASRYLPFMHYLRYPELFEIHMHVWYRTSFFDKELRYQESIIKRLSAEEMEILRYLNVEYEKHSIIEIWGPYILDDMYRKIESLVLSNTITDKEYLGAVLSNLRLLINRVKEIARKGHKSEYNEDVRGQTKVYINELELGTPMLYYESIKETKVFLIHQEPNFICTYQKGFCQYAKSLLQHIIDYSTAIGGEGSRSRVKYFKTVDQTYDLFCNKIYKVFDYANLK